MCTYFPTFTSHNTIININIEMKTAYYYQTFVGLEKLFTHLSDIDIINISSIHFDIDENKQGEIYLNDNIPTDKKFDHMWMETHKASVQGVTVMLMVGGAGGAYTNLFRDFDVYYPMLRDLLQSKPFISGIDLDIEEQVDIIDVRKMIRVLKRDFPDLKLSMAPISEAMQGSYPGMGGFSYKKLYQSPEGSEIDWFNVQCYGSFSFDTYKSIIQNGYPPSKIIMGHESGQFTPENFSVALEEVKKCLEAYPTMGGVYDWEYFNAPPDKTDPSQWAKLMSNISNEYFDRRGNIVLE
jgi:hypothetical protein